MSQLMEAQKGQAGTEEAPGALAGTGLAPRQSTDKYIGGLHLFRRYREPDCWRRDLARKTAGFPVPHPDANERRGIGSG